LRTNLRAACASLLREQHRRRLPQPRVFAARWAALDRELDRSIPGNFRREERRHGRVLDVLIVVEQRLGEDRLAAQLLGTPSTLAAPARARASRRGSRSEKVRASLPLFAASQMS